MQRLKRVLVLLAGLVLLGAAELAGAEPPPAQCQELEKAFNDAAAATLTKSLADFREIVHSTGDYFGVGRDASGLAGISIGGQVGMDACLSGLFDIGISFNFTDFTWEALLELIFKQLCKVATDFINEKIAELHKDFIDKLKLAEKVIPAVGAGAGVQPISVNISTTVKRDPWALYRWNK